MYQISGYFSIISIAITFPKGSILAIYKNVCGIESDIKMVD